MEKYVSIDYLQYTLPTLPHQEDELTEVSKLANYKYGFKVSECGTRYYTGHNKSEKVLVVESGDTVRWWRRHEDERQRISRLLDQGATFSRVDIAVDAMCMPPYVIPTAKMVADWCEDGLIVSSHAAYGAKTVYDATTRTHETCYVGDKKNRGKKGIFRAYDKGIESGKIDNHWMRYELELKRDNAKMATTRYLDYDLESIFRAKFDIRHDIWQSIFDSEPLDVSRGDNITRDKSLDSAKRWAWLIEQVAPALGRSIAIDVAGGNLSNYEAFNNAVRKAYDQEYIGRVGG